jgi:hypothetical protein
MKKVSLAACFIFALLIGMAMGHSVPISMADGVCDVEWPGGGAGWSYAGSNRIFLQLDSAYKVVNITKPTPRSLSIKIAKR